MTEPTTTGAVGLPWTDIRADVVDKGLVDPQAVDAAAKLMRDEVRAHKRSALTSTT